MHCIVSLSKETPYAIGDHKAAYVHPDSPNLLIKICHQAGLDEIMSWISKTNTILRELKTSNLVWDEQHAKFIIIDRVGSKPVFSLRLYSRRYNTRSNIKRVTILRERLAKELHLFNECLLVLFHYFISRFALLA